MKNISLSTPVKCKENHIVCSNDDTIVSLGSCFSEHIVGKLLECGFPGAQNPTGIIYNSYSLMRALELVVSNKPFTSDDLFECNDCWSSWDHHGRFSGEHCDDVLKKINETFIDFADKLKKAAVVVITPSSSVVYALKESLRIVANCHRVPGNQFERMLLSVDDNMANLSKSIELIRSVNADADIIFTLSPVRHYPGDLQLNSVSKANVRAAIHTVCNQFEKVLYFPSYEIVNDELRDYRFFGEDMLHPNDIARKIILQRFLQTYFSEQAVQQFIDGEKAHRRSQHIDRAVYKKPVS